MSTTSHAPKQIDPSASLHAEALGQAKSLGRLMGRRIIVVGAGQRTIVDEDPPIGNGRAMSVLFAREGATVACIDVNKEAADGTVGQITSEGGKAFAIASHSHVKDDVYVGVVERCQGFDLVLQQMNRAYLLVWACILLRVDGENGYFQCHMLLYGLPGRPARHLSS